MDLSSTQPLFAVTAADRQALAAAAAFLSRAGTALASQLLTPTHPAQDAGLLADLRDQLVATSLLCRVLSGEGVA